MSKPAYYRLLLAISGSILLRLVVAEIFIFIAFQPSHVGAVSRLQGAQILRLVNSEHFNERALCGCSFNISVPNTPLDRDISLSRVAVRW